MIKVNKDNLDGYYGSLIEDVKKDPGKYLSAFDEYANNSAKNERETLVFLMVTDDQILFCDYAMPNSIVFSDKAYLVKINNKLDEGILLELIQSSLSWISEQLITCESSLLDITTGYLPSKIFDPKSVLVISDHNIYRIRNRHRVFNVQIIDQYFTKYGMDENLFLFILAAGIDIRFDNFVSLKSFMNAQCIVEHHINSYDQKLKEDGDHQDIFDKFGGFKDIFESFVFGHLYSKYFKMYDDDELEYFKEEFKGFDESEFTKSVYDEVKKVLFKE